MLTTISGHRIETNSTGCFNGVFIWELDKLINRPKSLAPTNIIAVMLSSKEREKKKKHNIIKYWTLSVSLKSPGSGICQHKAFVTQICDE